MELTKEQREALEYVIDICYQKLDENPRFPMNTLYNHIQIIEGMLNKVINPEVENGTK